MKQTVTYTDVIAVLKCIQLYLNYLFELQNSAPSLMKYFFKCENDGSKHLVVKIKITVPYSASLHDAL